MKTTTSHKTEHGKNGSRQRLCSAQEMFNAAFAVQRSPRSPEYKAGVLAHLRFALKETGIQNPYTEGTAQSDAWYAGVQESWLILQANSIVPNGKKQLKDMLETAVDYMIEAHEEELNNNHYGDSEGDCSYCQFIGKAKHLLGKLSP